MRSAPAAAQRQRLCAGGVVLQQVHRHPNVLLQRLLEQVQAKQAPRLPRRALKQGKLERSVKGKGKGAIASAQLCLAAGQRGLAEQHRHLAQAAPAAAAAAAHAHGTLPVIQRPQCQASSREGTPGAIRLQQPQPPREQGQH